MNVSEHLLTCLAEECGEVIQNAGKSLRFGLDDRNVLDPTGSTNRERLVDELNDLIGVADMLADRGMIPKNWRDQEKQDGKQRKVAKFMDYAAGVGALR
jgi:NTP pyrophosphatase (non-canonical NTP hydrolase)